MKKISNWRSEKISKEERDRIYGPTPQKKAPKGPGVFFWAFLGGVVLSAVVCALSQLL